MKELNLKQYIKNLPSVNITLNERSNKILHKLMKELKTIYEATLKKIYTTELILNNFVKGALFNSIPHQIIKIIKTSQFNVNTKIFKWKIENYNIKLNVIYSNNKSSTTFKYVNDTQLFEYYVLTRTIIEFLYKHNKIKKHDITVYLYLTTHIKLVPDNINDVVGWIHVNTGLTANEHAEINIFRAEEWFKVLIHETIHNLSMDFNDIDVSLYKNTLKEIFIIKSDYLLFETYTELWAEIIQILFICILENTNNISNKINDELTFSLLQMNKIFSISTKNKATYNDLINRNKTALNLYKENSNCFAYYVLKTIGLYYINDFILWCSINNKPNLISFNNSIDNIMRFIDFFKKRYTNPELVKSINDVNNLINKKEGNFIDKTLRISIYEILI
jgi:hypothetical protein